jgi:hypothetical protein
VSRALRTPAALRLLAATVALSTALAAGWAAPAADAEMTARPVLGAPAGDLVPFGTEGSGPSARAWAYGTAAAQPAFVDGSPLTGLTRLGIVLLVTDEQGIWTIAGAPQERDGSPMARFRPATSTVSGDRALAAQMTPRGGGLLIGTDGDAQVLLVRDPAGPFRAIPAPSAAPQDGGSVAAATPPAGDAPVEPGADAGDSTTPTMTTTTAAPPPTATTPSPAATGLRPGTALAGELEPGERLYDPRDSLMPAAPVDDGGRTGVLIAPAPADGQGADGVLHWNGETWGREPIDVPAGEEDLRVVALAAASPGDAWLLARSAHADVAFMLFRRDLDAPGGPRWRRAGDLSDPLLGRLARLPAGVSIAAGTAGQQLTATVDGVWVDGTVTAGGATGDLTFFVAGDGTVRGSWCDAAGSAASLCSRPLGRDRTVREYRSAAWPGDGLGSRVVGGYGDGALLALQGDGFQRVLGAGRSIGATGSLAFAGPGEGWVGGSVLTRMSAALPARDETQPWPVPFRRPLLAAAPEPGRPAGALDAGALAVGDDGQVARYTPGSGWSPEFLLDGNDARATPRLRGVAWPRPELAFAVGDDGAMWRWRSVTGLWESDPGKPLNFDRQLTGVAFDPSDPDRGYAVGKDGTLLAYQKSWQEETPPAGLEHAQFTSIAFAGSEAIVAYRVVDPDDSTREVGGLIVNDGSGWRVEEQVAQLLARAGDAPLRKVAGLPDGGAVAAGSDVVVERDGPGAPWHYSSAPLAGVNDVAAVAAVRDGGVVRAVLSVDPYRFQSALDYLLTDQPLTPVPEGAPPFRVNPDPLPTTGQLLRETAGGWRDEQHAAFGFRPGPSVGDAPIRPDSVMALLLSPAGDAGWAVGGETGAIVNAPTFGAKESIQTAGVLRYPAAAASPPGTEVDQLRTTAGGATFAVGGGAQCAELCASLAGTAPGPDRWLPAALQRAAGIGGLRGFLYTGGRLADQAASAPATVRADEFHRYAALLSRAAALPVFPAAHASDADRAGSTAAFGSAFDAFAAPLGAGPTPDGVTPLSRTEAGAARTYYSFESTGAEGAVRVFVLDYSARTLGTGQLCWLAAGLGDAAAAGAPAIVVGSRPLTAGADGAALDATTVGPLLAGGVAPTVCPHAPAGRASAYFYSARGENRAVTLAAAGGSLPTFGTGSLGYSALVASQNLADFTASGFLLAAVDVARRNQGTNQAPVSVRLIPNVAELALDATDGTLLRRSEPALFSALARRPRGGMRYKSDDVPLPDPYVPIPARCLGGECASFISPEYEFRSSRPDIGDFVRQDSDSPDERTVLLGRDDKPIADHASGLFCPFNAGTTTVSVRAGGLVYSQTITVQPGSVRRPCGTVPLVDPPPAKPAEVVPDMPGPSPGGEPQPSTPGGTAGVVPPAVPAAPAPPVARPAPPPSPLPAVAIAPPFLVQLPNSGFLPPVIQPPAPPAARPSPPSGTSPVSSPVSQTAVAPEEKREQEVATEMSHNYAAYRSHERERHPGYLPALAVVAALAGLALRPRRPRDGERALAVNVVRDDRERRRR